MNWISGWRERLRSLKRETFALFLASRDERTPWYAKLTAAVVVAYAFSPIDLIPDFIPFSGYWTTSCSSRSVSCWYGGWSPTK